MAAQVLSGTGNVTYTNSTGQNVRVVINYLENGSPVDSLNMSFQGVSIYLPKKTKIGKALAYATGNINTRGYQSGRGQFGGEQPAGIPTEIALSNGETFALSIPGSTPQYLQYNVIIIPEAG